MDSPIFKQISKFLQDRKKHKHWTVIFTCMAILVCLGTVTALKLMGQAMTRKEKVLNCSLEVHQHTEECQDEAGNLICGLADYVVHVHNDDCYDSDGNLACTLPEISAHVHTDECYADEEVLICGFEEEEGHVHDEACYEQQVTGLACTAPEHQHGTGCYDENNNLICTATEHQHTGECYDAQGNLICGQAAHTHMGSCYDKDNNLVCTIAEHQHAAECLTVEDVLVCEEEEGAGGHVHTDECYETQKVLACGQLELHTHSIEGGCFEEVPPAEEGGEPTYNLICTTPVLEEHVHSEEAGCFVIVEAAVADAAESVNGTEVAQSTEAAVPAEAVSSTETPVPTEAVNSTEVIAENTTETKEETEEFFKACEGDGYVVSVTYGPEAGIPDEAELVASLITPESDPEHYAKREAEFQQQMEDESATMSALLKVGFYIDGTEIEPKAPVSVTVQLVDENGLPEGMPMTVVHFAAEGSEVIDSSQVKDGKTSFEMDSFSDIAVGYSLGDLKIDVDETCEYKDDAFEITFHVKGKAKVPPEMAASLPEDKIIALASVEDSNVSQTEGASNGNDGDSPLEEGSESQEDFPLEESGEPQKDAFENTGSSIEGLELNVELLGEDSDEYKAYDSYMKKESDGDEASISVRALTYSLTYSGAELDTSECKVTAEIMLVNEEEESDNAVGLTDAEGDDKEQSKTQVLAMTMVRDKVKKAGSLLVDSDKAQSEAEPMAVEVKGDSLGAARSETPNPSFIVQYYANIDRFAKSGNGSLDIIDTKGKKLPKNDVTPDTRNLYLKNTTTSGDANSRTEVKMESKLMEVYSHRKYDYIKAPSLNYFNALIENDGYVLKEIWVLKDKTKADSTEKQWWDIYNYSEKLHFTNRSESATAKPGENSGYIYIGYDAVIRLVYDTTKNENSEYDAVFYDYDISNGKVEGNTLATGHAGINSGLRKKADGKPENGQYAFGNMDWSDFGTSTWNNNNKNNLLNKANDGTYSGCTFGLATGASGENITMASGINAPKIFGTDDVEGKTRYPDSTLTFRRNGDSYTLRMAEVRDKKKSSKVESLDKFWCRPNWNNSRTLWSNNFWPLDQLKGKDPLMGSKAGQYTFTGATLSGNKPTISSPETDDKIDHNALFGMYYEVDFNLISEYTGPLEYVFFGDDDMWVFLDGQLVCDIGGVHGSVGEYVNLWEYLGTTDKEGNPVKGEDGKVMNIAEGSHTLQFFYTERGFSGSTCWMHFTLPSVTSRSPEDNKKDYGHLQVSKTVTDKKTNSDKETEDEFEFTIKLSIPQVDEAGNPVKDENGNTVMIPLPDDYSYWKYNPGETEPFAYDLIIQNGGHFTLKKGQYIVIRYLPQGTQYTIEEVEYPEYETEVNKQPAPDRKITGTISAGTGDEITIQEVTYNNIFSAYELPETGGSGKTPYTMAGVIVMFGAGFLYRKKIRERRV